MNSELEFPVKFLSQELELDAHLVMKSLKSRPVVAPLVCPSKFFDASIGKAIPRLTTWALPKIGVRFEAASGASVAL